MSRGCGRRCGAVRLLGFSRVVVPVYLAAACVNAFPLLAPAKLNLFLAVTGRRADGYHDLLSLVVCLDFGDGLRVEPAEALSLTCDDPELPADETNLAMKAARAFAGESGAAADVRIHLHKVIPTGAGLGGGSSDAATVLQELNRLAPPERRLDAARLAAVAARVGSDCPLFLAGGRPVILRGRGEQVVSVPDEAASRLRGRRVLVFKPGFGVSTPWAYGQLAAGAPGTYLPAGDAEQRLGAWLGDPGAPVEQLLFNSFESVVNRKFVALPVLGRELRERFGLEPRLSGSGSASFAFVPEGCDVAAVAATIREAWGASAFVQEARVL